MPLLIWKLSNEYFIKGKYLKALQEFLTDRKASVKINGHQSAWLEDKVGVPQGGALSPVLFLMHVDYLCIINNLPGLHFGIFADDLVLYSSYKDQEKIRHALQTGVLYIQWYTLHHGLYLNLSKTQYKIFKKHGKIKSNQILSIYLSGQLISVINQVPATDDSCLQYESGPVKHLEIWLDNKLQFKDHVSKLEQKIL